LDCGRWLASIDSDSRRAVCRLPMTIVASLLEAVVAVSVVGVVLIPVAAELLTALAIATLIVVAVVGMLISAVAAASPAAAAVTCLRVITADGEAKYRDQHTSQREQFPSHYQYSFGAKPKHGPAGQNSCEEQTSRDQDRHTNQLRSS